MDLRTAAEVTTRVLQRAGVHAYTLRVDAMFFNTAALRCVASRRDVREDPAAWSVAAIHPNYHAVTVVESTLLYDATSYQFSRPERGLEVPNPLIVDFDGASVEFELDKGGRGVYQRQPEQLPFNPLLIAELRRPAIRRFIEEWAALTRL